MDFQSCHCKLVRRVEVGVEVDEPNEDMDVVQSDQCFETVEEYEVEEDEEGNNAVPVEEYPTDVLVNTGAFTPPSMMSSSL